MSFLCKKHIVLKQSTFQERPSPTKTEHISCLAQSICFFIKRILLFTSCLRKKTDASMTVEAAIVLPLFLFFFLNLGSAIEMIRLHGNLELALWEVGNRLTVYGHALEGGNKIAGVALSYTYVKAQIEEYLGEEYLESSPLSHGTSGLQFWESDMCKSDGTFDMVVTYAVSPLSSMAAFHSFRMTNRYYGHLWNGYAIPGTEELQSEQYVYITATGEVFHTNPACSHLALSIRQITYSGVFSEQNRQGERYGACEKCGKCGVKEYVYITDEGDCYHFEKECPGLKRTVLTVPISQVAGRRLCKRCGS